MANTFGTNTQRQLFKEGVQDEIRAAIPFRDVADVDTSDAEYVHFRYGADLTATNTTDGTYTPTDFTYTDDTVEADKEAVVPELIKRKELSNSGNGKGGFLLKDDRVQRHARALAVAIHRNAYRETVDAAGLTLDNEVLAGSASALTAITASSTNVDDIATKAYELMQNVGLSSSEGRPYFMMDPGTARFFKLWQMGAAFNTSDRQINNGWAVVPTLDFDYIVTPEVEHEVTLTESGTISADDSVTVKGVTFVFKASPSTAGQVDVGSDDDESMANLAAAINGGAGAGTAYIALSAANRKILTDAGIVATASAADSNITITGFGPINLVKNVGTNLTAGTEKKNLLVGIRNSTLLRIPSGGFTMVENDALEADTGVQLRTSQMHGAGVWTKNADRICKLLVAK